MPVFPAAEAIKVLSTQMRTTPGGSAARPHAFLKITRNYRNRPDIVWRLLHQEWSGFDAIPYAQFGQLLERLRPHWRRAYIPGDDLRTYDALPAEFEVWRGQDANAPHGLS